MNYSLAAVSIKNAGFRLLLIKMRLLQVNFLVGSTGVGQLIRIWEYVQVAVIVDVNDYSHKFLSYRRKNPEAPAAT